MGCYDTVNFFCPSCDAHIPEQTKASTCDMRQISPSETPADIAIGMEGDMVWCPRCYEQFTIVSEVVKTVKLKLRKTV